MTRWFCFEDKSTMAMSVSRARTSRVRARSASAAWMGQERTDAADLRSVSSIIGALLSASGHGHVSGSNAFPLAL